MQRGNDLQQQRVVVVGGSSGIGLAVAQQAATQGAKVVIVSSNAERVQKAVEFISGEAQGQAVNVSDEGAVATFFAKLGSFDHLVFTAGDALQLNDLAATDLAKARHAFELRYWAALAAVKYASPHIRKDGSIVLTTGVAGRRPHKGRKHLRNYRSLDACPGGRVGADSRQRGISWRRSNEPLAEHEYRRKGAPV
jgi:NAD(P)-dependent dehydrogenase (short-subunit alcohol dehydrogenase family)